MNEGASQKLSKLRDTLEWYRTDEGQIEKGKISQLEVREIADSLLLGETSSLPVRAAIYNALKNCMEDSEIVKAHVFQLIDDVFCSEPLEENRFNEIKDKYRNLDRPDEEELKSDIIFLKRYFNFKYPHLNLRSIANDWIREIFESYEETGSINFVQEDSALDILKRTVYMFGSSEVLEYL